MDINEKFIRKKDEHNYFLMTLGFDDTMLDEFKTYMEKEIKKMSSEHGQTSYIIELTLKFIFKKFKIEREPTVEEVTLLTIANYIGAVESHRKKQMSAEHDVLSLLRKIMEERKKK